MEEKKYFSHLRKRLADVERFFEEESRVSLSFVDRSSDTQAIRKNNLKDIGV